MRRKQTGVTFKSGNLSYHTYDDFDLILESTELTYPEPKTETIDVPERDGVIDLTAALTGVVRYNNRTLTIHLVDLHDRKHYSAITSMLAEKIHGKTFEIILDKDSFYYYKGRVTVSSFEPQGKTDSTNITLTCDVEPFKYSTQNLSGPWKWDPFNFYTGHILRDGSMEVNGQTTMTLDVGVVPSIPVFYSSNPMEVQINDGEPVSLPSGAYTGTDVILPAGKSTLTFTGQGIVGIDVKVRSF